MKKFLFLAFAAMAVLFNSCNDEEKIVLNFDSFGSLVVNLKTASGQPIADESVIIESYGYYDIKKTDANGRVDFGRLNLGEYFIFVEKVEEGSEEYNIEQPISIVSGAAITKDIIPSEYVGTYELTLFEGYDETFLNNVDVYLVDEETYYLYEDAGDKIAHAYRSGRTNSAGKVIFENVPSDTYFYVYYEYDTDEYYSIGELYLYKGETEEDIYKVWIY